MKHSRITVSAPLLIGRELDYVMDCIGRNELTFGHYCQRFEKEFAEFCGTKFALACNNGTSALHLALLAIGVRPGDHVLVPALTYVASANAVRYCGATPVFCDVDPKTWTMDPQDAYRALSELRAETARIKAIMPVHLYGIACNMDAIKELAREFECDVVEDAAEAHGATYDGKRVGGIGTLGTFSFYGNKMMTSGEGGAVVTDNESLYERMVLYRGQGVSKSRRYWHTVVGYNYRMPNILAAVATAQLETFHTNAGLRHVVWADYTDALQDFETQHIPEGTTHAPWMFSVLVPKGIDRDTVMRRLDQRGIETRPLFPPIPSLPPYVAYGLTPPVTEDLAMRGINLPTHPGLTPPMVKVIANEFKEAVKRG